MPVTWLVAANDTYFSPALSRQIAASFRGGGGEWIFACSRHPAAKATGWSETDGGVKIAAPELARALKALTPGRGEKTMTHPWPDDDVIFYHGVCVFCSRWIRFVAARDAMRRFRFTAIQSDYGRRLAQAFGIDPEAPDTNAVVHGGVAYFKSDAGLTVLSRCRAGDGRACCAGAETTPRCGVQPVRAQPVPDFREV